MTLITDDAGSWPMTSHQARQTAALAAYDTPLPVPVSGDRLAGVPHYRGRLSAVAQGTHLVPDPPLTRSEAAAMVELSNMLDGQLGIRLMPWQV